MVAHVSVTFRPHTCLPLLSSQYEPRARLRQSMFRGPDRASIARAGGQGEGREAAGESGRTARMILPSDTQVLGPEKSKVGLCWVPQ